MIRGKLSSLAIILSTLLTPLLADEKLPIDQLWQSETFRKAYTASYGIDSKVEPLINEDEAFYLNEAAKLMVEADREAAIEKLKSSDIADKSPALLFSLGNFHYEEGKPKDAIAYFEKAIKLFPNFRDAHRNLAMLEIQEGKLDASEKHLTRAIELGSQEGLTYGLLAYCHTQKKRLQAALSAYRMAQVTMPDEPQWQLGEAFTLQALDEAEKACSIYANLIEKNPTDPILWINQANAYAQKEDFANAIAHLEIANRMGDLSPQNRVVLGQMFLEQSIIDLALSNFQQSIQDKRVTVKTAIGSLSLLANNHYWKEVKQFGKQCSSLYQPELAVKENRKLRSAFQRTMAMAELETGESEAGAKRVEKLLTTNPLDGDALLLLAKFREEKDQTEEAIILLEQAAVIPEKKAMALLSHGRILVNQFRYEEALKLLDESFAIAPTDSLKIYIEAIRELKS